ncbi:hypothetical protein WR25_20864 [Diploscapter pachys]|uniref:Uncharacterized protein n=1 Tax=Diploscapter pachys TaxID=2018661 RepID=A0A2A2JPZ3_9BILA|nr:hypothetical protein WR25_20864 [Diploscapter pachys]
MRGCSPWRKIFSRFQENPIFSILTCKLSALAACPVEATLGPVECLSSTRFVVLIDFLPIVVPAPDWEISSPRTEPSPTGESLEHCICDGVLGSSFCRLTLRLSTRSANFTSLLLFALVLDGGEPVHDDIDNLAVDLESREAQVVGLIRRVLAVLRDSEVAEWTCTNV